MLLCHRSAMGTTHFILSLIVFIRKRELYASVICSSKSILFTVYMFTCTWSNSACSYGNHIRQERSKEKPYVSNLHMIQQNTALVSVNQVTHKFCWSWKFLCMPILVVVHALEETLNLLTVNHMSIMFHFTCPCHSTFTFQPNEIRS